MTGSRMLRFGDAMSILARSVREPSGNSPAFMRANRSRFSSTERLRYGLSLPGSVSVPRYCRISLGGQVADVRLAGPDQLHGPFVELAEIIGGVEEAVFPIEAEPAHVLHDGIDVLGLLLFADWCRRSAGWSCRRIPPPGRNSGRSIWRGRCADSRSAPAESACARGPDTCWSSGRRG